MPVAATPPRPGTAGEAAVQVTLAMLEVGRVAALEVVEVAVEAAVEGGKR